MTQAATTPIDADRVLEMTRLFGAPKQLVLKMWTDPAMITHWWGPFGFSTDTTEMDFQPGGVWLFTMISAAGERYPNFIRYTETGPDRIAFEHSANGGQDIDFRCEIEFVEVDPGRTRMTFRHIYPSAEVREMIAEKYGAKQGLAETLTRLDVLLSDRQSSEKPFRLHLSQPSPNETRMTRSFRAPRALVFAAMTQEKHLRNWQAPYRLRIVQCDVESRLGGKWKLLLEDETGNVGGFLATFVEFEEPSRFAVRYEFAERTDLNHTSFNVLEESDGITKLTMTTVFDTTDARNEMVQIGFDSGTAECFERLETRVLLPSDDQRFTISRAFKASQELVWKAWTESERLAKWWGPLGCSIRVAQLNVRPGGIFHFAMESERGTMWGRFVYREVRPTSELAFVNSFSDEEGRVARAPFSNAWPLEVLNLVSFAAEGEGTRMELEAIPLSSDAAELKQFVEWFDSLKQGFGGTFDQLEAFLEEG